MNHEAVLSLARQVVGRVRSARFVARIRNDRDLRVYYGCGLTHQKGYVNVDIRWTPAVDVMGDLEWCSREFAGRCAEVFMSHVLEHYRSPGKGWRTSADSVPGALNAAARMLRPGGVLRIAVPDFGTLARLYAQGKVTLYPKLLGRLCGEQNYVENLHRCAFDREFLEYCLKQAGFTDITTWSPRELNFDRDASFDEIDGVATSLNLAARKPGAS